MNLKSFYPRVWMIAGAIVLGWSVSWGDVALSTAPLAASTTGAAEPFVNPFGTKNPKIVSGFGRRDVPAALLSGVSTGTTTGSATLGAGKPLSEMHEGVDYRAFPGSLVRASRSGKVIFAGFSKMYVSRADKSDQDRLVIIRHPDGMSTRYVHLNALRVKPGQDVQSGQPLGVLAESDEWTEPVLHFEIRNVHGQAINPMKLVDTGKTEDVR